MALSHKVHGQRDEGRDREAGDRQQALRDAGEAEWRQRAPERLVQRQVGAQGEQPRDQHREAEKPCETAPAPDGPQTAQRQQGRQPADEDELLDAGPDAAREEVRQLGGVAPYLGERPPSVRDRAGDDELLDRDCDHRCDGGPEARLPPVGSRHPCPGIPQSEDDRPHREVDLPREGDRREEDRGPDEPSPFEREQHRRQEKGDQAEEVARRLPDPVGREREHEPSHEGCAPGDPERAQPPTGGSARRDDGEQHDQVVGPHGPEQVAQRPERDSEQPALEVRRCRGLGTEGVGVGPRCGPPLELTAGKPEGPAELQVVACGGLPETGSGSRQVVTLDVADGGPGSPDRTGEVDR